MTGQKVALAGSYRADPPGATYVGDVDPDERVVVTVLLKRRSPDTFTPSLRASDQPPVARRQPRLQALAGTGGGTGLCPTEIAALYGIPLDRDVSSVCVGIVALGGGYLASDLAKALAAMGRQAPNVVDQSVVLDAPATDDGSVVQNGNNFGGGTVSDQEIALDLQILAGLLPRARIVV